MEGVNHLLVECATRSLNESRVDMTIPWMGGVRTSKEQNDIYLAGNSQLDGIERRSYHQIEAFKNGLGNALDIIPVDGKYSNTDGMLYFSKLMFNNYQQMVFERYVTIEDYGFPFLEWGGHWSNGWDKPHYQIVYR